jgi:SNF2 family DNA or RNA helicase
VLRRLKRDVLDPSLFPPKRDVVVYCGMSSLQKEYYRMALDGTLRDSLLAMEVEGAKAVTHLNQLMMLRKICNHPFLYGDLKDAQGRDIREANVKLLVMASGKVPHHPFLLPL